MQNLEKKDYFYYTDMIADLRLIAGLGKIEDEFQKERIQERHRYVKKIGETGNVIFVTSDYKNELIDICNEIYRRATGKDELTFLYEIRDFLPEVEDAIVELQLKRRSSVLEAEYPKFRITSEILQEIMEHPEKFIHCDVRVYQGKIYTEEEFQKMISENTDETFSIDEGYQPKLRK